MLCQGPEISPEFDVVNHGCATGSCCEATENNCHDTTHFVDIGGMKTETGGCDGGCDLHNILLFFKLLVEHKQQHHQSKSKGNAQSRTAECFSKKERKSLSNAEFLSHTFNSEFEQKPLTENDMKHNG